MPFSVTFCGPWLALATVNLYTKYEISMLLHYEDIKGDENLKKNWGSLEGYGSLKVIGNITI